MGLSFYRRLYGRCTPAVRLLSVVARLPARHTGEMAGSVRQPSRFLQLQEAFE